MSALERIDYTDDEAALTGWLVRPVGTPRGAVVVFPTIANNTPAIERRAEMLADKGFVAFIADFYGKPMPDLTLPDAMAQVRAMAEELRKDVDRYRSRLIAAVAALRGHESAQGLPIAAIGFCMGGQAVLELARAGEDLALVVSFHGLLDTKRAATAPIVPRILVCHGDADPMVPRSQVMAFWEEMDSVGADWHFHAYANVKHGFTDPASDKRGMAAIAYDSSADRQSWAAMLNLFDEVLGG